MLASEAIQKMRALLMSLFVLLMAGSAYAGHTYVFTKTFNGAVAGAELEKYAITYRPLTASIQMMTEIQMTLYPHTSAFRRA